jgi:hypothetical protein
MPSREPPRRSAGIPGADRSESATRQERSSHFRCFRIIKKDDADARNVSWIISRKPGLLVLNWRGRTAPRVATARQRPWRLRRALGPLRVFAIGNRRPQNHRLRRHRKSLFESSDSVREIISAGRQRPGKHWIPYLGAIECAGLFLLSGDFAVEDLDDAKNVGNQHSCLQRFPCRRRLPKMRLMFHCMLQNDPDSSR